MNCKPTKRMKMNTENAGMNLASTPELIWWISEDPTRLAKACKDMARWTRYMKKEMLNPAFQLFIAMACNFTTP